MATPSVIVSISYGDRDKATYERTTHLLTFEEVKFYNVEAAKNLADGVIELLQSIAEKGSNDAVFGIYKEEFNSDPKVN